MSNFLIPDLVMCRIMPCGSQNGRKVGYFQVQLTILEGAAVLEVEVSRTGGLSQCSGCLERL